MNSDDRRARRGQPFWFALGLLFLLPAMAATALRVLPFTDPRLQLAASFISFALLGYAIAAVALGIGLLRARRRGFPALLTLVAVLGFTLHAVWTFPLFVPDDRPATGESFSLVSLNALAGEADPEELVAAAADADVVVLLEVTPALVDDLADLGWHDRFTYSVGEPRRGLNGSVIYSRFALTEQERIDSAFAQWVAEAEVPNVGPVSIFAVHPCNPFCTSGFFDAEHEQLRATATKYLDRRLVIAGDFNAVDDHRPMVELRRDGLRSATDIVGAGWLPTYPAQGAIPPLIAIDHVLLSSSMTATTIETFDITGTDHRGLRAELAPAG